MTIPIMHCFDDRYCAPAAVSFLSMLEHADQNYHYDLYVVHEDISEKHQQMLQSVVGRFKNASLKFMNPPKNIIGELFDSMPFKAHYSKEVLYKMIAPDMFPGLDHIIITDVDVLWCDDIVQGYKEFLEDDKNWLAGIAWDSLPCEWVRRTFEGGYGDHFSKEELKLFTSGVGGGYLIYNLKRMRADDVSNRMLAAFKENAYRLEQAEQDAINIACVGKMHFLGQRNMVCTYHYDHLSKDEQAAWADALEKPVQLHYATDTKPWNSPGSMKADLWWAYLCRTPFYREVASRFDQKETKTDFSLFGIRILRIWHTGAITRMRFFNHFQPRALS